MDQEFGDDGKRLVDQLYIQLERGDRQALYAFPAVLSEGQKLVYTAQSHPLVLSDVYEHAKQARKTMISYSSFDIAKGKKRQVSTCYPVIIDGEYRGGIVWEADQL